MSLVYMVSRAFTCIFGYHRSHDFTHRQGGSKSGKSKKPLSGFMLFSKEHRPKIKEDNPDITVSAFSPLNESYPSEVALYHQDGLVSCLDIRAKSCQGL